MKVTYINELKTAVNSSIHPSICLSVCPATCPSIHPSTPVGSAIHLVDFSVHLLCTLNPSNHQKTVQEVRLDNIRQKRGFSLLVDQSYDIVTNVSLPL